MVNNISGSTEENEESIEDVNSSKRGRGRPSGSLNKGNGTKELQAEVDELRSTINSLKDVIEQMQNAAGQAAIPTTNSHQGAEAQRLTVIQAWVEAFHHYLNTGRITNSVDGTAEAALEEIMRKLPENPSVDEYQSLEATVTRERYYSIQHGGDAS
jgi:hypothetical protein